MYLLYFYVPESHLETVKEAIFAEGAGHVGNYNQVAWHQEGLGQFCPLAGSNPTIGHQDEIAKIKEYKVETACESKNLKNVLRALVDSHPYEIPAYGAIEVTTL
jgi:structural hemagglutinin/hemolysin toxin protein RtxA